MIEKYLVKMVVLNKNDFNKVKILEHIYLIIDQVFMMKTQVLQIFFKTQEDHLEMKV